jgi:integrase
MLTLFSTGLRAAEVLALCVEDLDLDGNLITVRRGKGRKFRIVAIGPQVGKALDKYLAHPKRQDQGQDYVFLTDEGQPPSRPIRIPGGIVRRWPSFGMVATWKCCASCWAMLTIRPRFTMVG